MVVALGDFDWDGYVWRTTLDGGLHIVFAPEGRGPEPLGEDELALVQWLVDNRAAVVDSALAAVFEEYPGYRDQYGYDEDELAEYMPEVASVAELQALMTLRTAYVHPLVVADVPYVGVEFDCTWDEEHGAGVMLQGTRVVRVGGADSAILLWIARKDAETRPNGW